MTATQKTTALLLYMDAVVETVAAVDSPTGVPGGHLYAALMSYMSLESFETLMGSMVKAELLTRSGQCYHVTSKGREFHFKLVQAGVAQG